MSRFTLALSFSAVFAGLTVAGGVELQEGIEPALRDRAKAAWSDGDWDAAAIVVSIGDEILFSSAIGKAGDPPRKATVHTPLHAAPLAHTFLSSLVVRAAEEGKVALDAELGDLLPELVGEDNHVHVKHLLNHTSGFVDCFGRDPLEGQEGATIWTGLRDVVREPLETDPGTCVAPTTTNTLLLAAVIEVVEKRSAADVIETDLFDALDMDDSRCDPPAEKAEVRDASSPKQGEGEPSIEPAADFDPHWLAVSAVDLARFQRALIDDELFGEDSYREMTTPTHLDDGSQSPVGFGVRQIRVGGVVGVNAGADDVHGAAFVRYFPSHDLTIAVVAQGGSADLEGFADDLAFLVLAPPERPLADILLEPDDAEPYLGTYQIGCNSLIIRSQDGRLLLDDAAKGELVLLNQGEHRFVARDDRELTLVFEIVDGRAESFVLDEHGVEAVATRFD